MPLPITGIILRLTHTGLAGDSVFLSDLGDGTDPGSYRKVGPVYVPRLDPTTKTFPGSVDLPYANDVQLSHRRGAIRSFVDNGYLTEQFLFGPTFLGGLYVEELATHELDPSMILRPDGLGGLQWLPGGDSLRDYVFTQDVAVPIFGTLYLKAGTVTTASVPWVINAPMVMRGATISVEVGDVVRAYALRILKNGVWVENLTLPLGATKAVTSTFTTVLATTDEVAVYVTRIAGPVGKSEFQNILATLELLEL